MYVCIIDVLLKGTWTPPWLSPQNMHTGAHTNKTIHFSHHPTSATMYVETDWKCMSHH